MNTLDNGSGRFALCDGNNIPFSFEVLLNKPYMDGNGGESHALIKMMGDPGHESLVSLELGRVTNLAWFPLAVSQIPNFGLAKVRFAIGFPHMTNLMRQCSFSG